LGIKLSSHGSKQKLIFCGFLNKPLYIFGYPNLLGTFYIYQFNGE